MHVSFHSNFIPQRPRFAGKSPASEPNNPVVTANNAQAAPLMVWDDRHFKPRSGNLYTERNAAIMSGTGFSTTPQILLIRHQLGELLEPEGFAQGKRLAILGPQSWYSPYEQAQLCRLALDIPEGVTVALAKTTGGPETDAGFKFWEVRMSHKTGIVATYEGPGIADVVNGIRGDLELPFVHYGPADDLKRR